LWVSNHELLGTKKGVMVNAYEWQGFVLEICSCIV